ncbi:MAG: hypothetical protein OXU30_05195 [Gammaproteobacteria bacterium]|nr:hypothetical protein [Gammaproteobacteria bacterium]
MPYLIIKKAGLYGAFSLLLLISLNVKAQTTLELDEFNAAYLQYGETKDSQPAVAREAARRAYELGKELFGASSERSAMLAINYATLIEDEAESQIYLDEAIEIYQTVFGFGSTAMIDPLMRLGRTLNDQNRESLASQYYGRALQLAQSNLGEESSKAGSIELELAAINLHEGDLDQSWGRLNRAKSILGNYSDAGSLSGLVRINLLTGEYFLARQQYLEAVGPLLASLENFTRFPSANVTIRNRIALINVYENLGDQASATEHCLAIGATRRLSEGENLRPVFTVIPEPLLESENRDPIRVEFLVDSQGFVRNPSVATELGDDSLEKIVLDSISRFRFAPRFVDGKVVASPDQFYVFR